MEQDMKVIVSTFESTATVMGNNFWLIVACVVSFSIMAMGIASGIEKANKIMMPALLEFSYFYFVMCFF